MQQLGGCGLFAVYITFGMFIGRQLGGNMGISVRHDPKPGRRGHLTYKNAFRAANILILAVDS